MGIFDWVDGKLFDVQWYFTEERKIRKSLKRSVSTVDEAIETLESLAAKETDSKGEPFSKEEILEKDEIEESSESAQEGIGSCNYLNMSNYDEVPPEVECTEGEAREY